MSNEKPKILTATDINRMQVEYWSKKNERLAELTGEMFNTLYGPLMDHIKKMFIDSAIYGTATIEPSPPCQDCDLPWHECECGKQENRMDFSEILKRFKAGRAITRIKFIKEYRECETYSYRYVIRNGKRWVEVGDAYSEPRYYDAFSLEDIFADDWLINTRYRVRELSTQGDKNSGQENKE